MYGTSVPVFDLPTANNLESGASALIAHSPLFIVAISHPLCIYRTCQSVPALVTSRSRLSAGVRCRSADGGSVLSVDKRRRKQFDLRLSGYASKVKKNTIIALRALFANFSSSPLQTCWCLQHDRSRSSHAARRSGNLEHCLVLSTALCTRVSWLDLEVPCYWRYRLSS